jgi:hypothetical protein
MLNMLLFSNLVRIFQAPLLNSWFRLLFLGKLQSNIEIYSA